MVQPSSLVRDVSPPPLRKHATATQSSHAGTERDEQSQQELKKSKAAAIEAHEVFIRDHLTYFVQHLSSASRPSPGPRITIEHFANTYMSNQHAKGAHFVVHQHDHPVAGVHYDLRLQFSGTSTVSWAIPYGLPGNANSLRPNRMAIETRVHNLWVGSIRKTSVPSLISHYPNSFQDQLTDTEQPNRISITCNRLATHLGYWRIRSLGPSAAKVTQEHR